MAGLQAGTVEAFCLDSAVGSWGAAVTDALEGVTGKTKAMVQAGQQRVLERWLSMPGQRSQQTFRAPAVGQRKG
jgi:hypothetical protein